MTACGHQQNAVLKAKGIDATAPQHARLQAGVRDSLENHAGKTVRTVGEGSPKRGAFSNDSMWSGE